MLPPVLEIYVLWHPQDTEGEGIAQSFVEHFHGSRFSGLLGGAIEVYTRSHGWRDAGDAPRAIPLPGSASDTGLVSAEFVVIVPVVGNELAFASANNASPWARYLSELVTAAGQAHSRIGIFPMLLDTGAASDTWIGELLGSLQFLARSNPSAPAEPQQEFRCRDLAQGLTRHLGGVSDAKRIAVFISHTKRAGQEDEEKVLELIELVRRVLSYTRLDTFFDASDLQPGEDWDAALRKSAGSSAVLVLRTDLFASRTWCQREVCIAKQSGMPIVVLEGLVRGEERGSFMLDHLPRIPVRREGESWRIDDIRRGLNLLVDECLKAVLWQQQERLAEQGTVLDVDWWAPHAPEPLTLIDWVLKERKGGGRHEDGRGTLILHPDPPLTSVEREVLDQLASLAKLRLPMDVLTPRTLAARGAPEAKRGRA